MEMSHKTQFFRSAGNDDASCQKHMFISMNGPQISHCSSVIDYLCDVPFKDTVFATDSFIAGSVMSSSFLNNLVRHVENLSYSLEHL